MLVASVSVVAVAEDTSKSIPVMWYTDGAFEPFVLPAHPVITQSEWNEILKRNWGEYGAATMNGSFTVDSCEQAFAARRSGLHPTGSANDVDIYQGRLIACSAARAVGHAVPAKSSYLSNFKMNATDARNLPAALTLVISNSDAAEIARATKLGKTLGDVLPRGATFTVEHNPRGDAPMVRVNDESGGIEDMSLLARGDFDHDGIEDLLIAVSSRVVGGTYTQSDLYLVTKLGPKAPMKVLKMYPDLGLGIPTFQ